MQRTLIPSLLLALCAAYGCAANGDLCTAPRMADPTSACYCLEIGRDEDPPYSDNRPPDYHTDDDVLGGESPLYAPEAVRPSRGRGVPSGPVVIP